MQHDRGGFALDKMRASYRKKGRWPNGETKIIIEYYDEFGKFRTFTLPKARTLINVLKKFKKPEGIKDAKNCELSDPKVNK